MAIVVDNNITSENALANLRNMAQLIEATEAAMYTKQNEVIIEQVTLSRWSHTLYKIYAALQ